MVVRVPVKLSLLKSHREWSSERKFVGLFFEGFQDMDLMEYRCRIYVYVSLRGGGLKGEVA